MRDICFGFFCLKYCNYRYTIVAHLKIWLLQKFYLSFESYKYYYHPIKFMYTRVIRTVHKHIFFTQVANVRFVLVDVKLMYV